MGQLLGRSIDWLMRPRVRRFRRWSSVVTVPFALAVAQFAGLHQVAWVVAARLALFTLIVLFAWRQGGERGDALRDLLMHPRARALTRAEFDVVTAMPRLALARLTGQHQPGTEYYRGSFGLALALAFTPAVVTEAAAVHLLIGGGWVAWVVTALHGYMLVWLWGFLLGPHAYPHRIGARAVVLRSGPLYRVRVPLDAIVSATTRTERMGDGTSMLQERDGVVLLAARGRVDVWLELSEPVGVQRALAEPIVTSRIAIASDDPAKLVEGLLAPAQADAERRMGGPARRGSGLIGAIDLAGITRDVAQHG